MPPSTRLDTDLIAECEAETRRHYAALLAALGRAIHAGAGPFGGWLADAFRAADRLCQSLAAARATAQFLAAAPGVFRSEVETRFPLATPQTVELVQTLMLLAVYSGAVPEQVDRVEQIVRHLNAMSTPPAVALHESEYYRAA